MLGQVLITSHADGSFTRSVAIWHIFSNYKRLWGRLMFFPSTKQRRILNPMMIIFHDYAFDEIGTKKKEIKSCDTDKKVSIFFMFRFDFMLKSHIWYSTPPKLFWAPLSPKILRFHQKSPSLWNRPLCIHLHASSLHKLDLVWQNWTCCKRETPFFTS